ncbi:MAG TPA: signal peptide peptidase SppA [Beijerinckiaceae bacterium]|jgi:protease-4|nr:signal peptide peptidase SppA [Beijerinckiaceae bacterium]
MSDPTNIASDYLVDRRQLRRRLSFWRVFAFVALAIALIAGFFRFEGRGGLSFSPYIARVGISGLITGDRATLQELKLLEQSRAAAIILSIESPGGTTSGSEREYDAIRRLAAKKPVVAVVDDLAASGAYITALGADYIVAPGNSLVGSIGVLFQYPDFSKLLGTIGVQVDEVKSSPLKAAPNSFEPTSPEARAALAALVADSYAWFKGLVQDRRHMNDEELAVVSDGRVFTGRQALPLKLIDAVGGEQEAVDWLENTKKIPKNLPIRDVRPSGGLNRLGIFGFSADIASTLGLDSLAGLLRRFGDARQAQLLDGLLAIWQAGAAN